MTKNAQAIVQNVTTSIGNAASYVTENLKLRENFESALTPAVIIGESASTFLNYFWQNNSTIDISAASNAFGVLASSAAPLLGSTFNLPYVPDFTTSYIYVGVQSGVYKNLTAAQSASFLSSAVIANGVTNWLLKSPQQIGAEAALKYLTDKAKDLLPSATFAAGFDAAYAQLRAKDLERSLKLHTQTLYRNIEATTFRAASALGGNIKLELGEFGKRLAGFDNKEWLLPLQEALETGIINDQQRTSFIDFRNAFVRIEVNFLRTIEQLQEAAITASTGGLEHQIRAAAENFASTVIKKDVGEEKLLLAKYILDILNGVSGEDIYNKVPGDMENLGLGTEKIRYFQSIFGALFFDNKRTTTDPQSAVEETLETLASYLRDRKSHAKLYGYEVDINIAENLLSELQNIKKDAINAGEATLKFSTLDYVRKAAVQIILSFIVHHTIDQTNKAAYSLLEAKAEESPGGYADKTLKAIDSTGEYIESKPVLSFILDKDIALSAATDMVVDARKISHGSSIPRFVAAKVISSIAYKIIFSSAAYALKYAHEVHAYLTPENIAQDSTLPIVTPNPYYTHEEMSISGETPQDGLEL